MSVGRFLQQAAAGNSGGTGDDDFANVVLLLDGDGTSGDNNNTFTDSSTNGYTITESGSVVQGSFSPYGDNWSNYFDVDLLSTSFSAIGSSDFTLEFWAMVEEDTTGRWFAGTGTSTGSFQIGAGSGGKWSFFTENNVNRFNGTTSIQKSTWYHVAVSRSGSTIKLFVNGSEEASATDSVNYSATSLGIGGYSSTNASCYGYISNFRIVVGTALYTSAFTPSTTPLTAITNTKLLTCQSNRFVDNSSDGNSISIQTGTPKVTPFSPFKNDDARDITTDGGSGYFDGSSDLASSGSVNWSTHTNITLEAWVYPTSLSSSTVHVLMGTASGTSGYTAFYLYSDGRIGIGIIGVNEIASASGIIKNNKWQHVVAVKSGSTTTLYVDGVSVASATTAVWSTNSAVFRVGRAGVPERMYGYLTDVRVVLGTAIVPSTLPTSPLTAVTNTEFLLNFQDAGIYDRSGINNLDTLGNAQIDTAVKKYGTGSMEFDGTGDYLKTVENETLELGSGDWTIEFWIYFDAVNNSTVKYLLDWRTAADTSNSFLAQESNNNWTYYNGAGASISSGFTSSTFSASTWHHVAISKAGTTTKFFVDGTQTASSSDVSTYDSGTLVIGSRYNGQNYLDGYIDDLRITKGIARYTSSFTPPTAALPKF